MNKPEHVAIIGAGLVGSLLSIYLARRGYRVSLFERRPDMRKISTERGRSINLALSNRGIRALAEVGLDQEIARVAIPMTGRMMHDHHGGLSFLPYGRQGQFINSISRGNLNMVLLNHAENAGVHVSFEHRCHRVHLAGTTVEFMHRDAPVTASFDAIIGADGAYSAVRGALQIADRFDYSQDYIDHGYKEFHIPPGPNGTFRLERNALHIWPRESFMMIALPNPDGSFTCTLFYPFEGKASFASLTSDEEIRRFMQTEFPDAVALMPDFLKDFLAVPPSSLVTVRCSPWSRHRVFLIGDAAHAIVPFYGQGMNAGFEDCRILNDLLSEYHDDWDAAIARFQHERKPDTDAIAQLALDNFVEMRDLVADPDFLLRKKIEAKLHELYPDKWIPLYSMVTFHDKRRYSDALAMGQRQRVIMDDVMKSGRLEERWQSLDFAAIVNRLS